nr:aminoglycoside phosphotransferase family protein [uncultured Friedmanniella sp.]
MDLDRESLITAVRAEGRRDVVVDDAVLHAGCESVVLATRDGWILRFPRPHVDFDREVAVLRRLDGRLPVPIPRVEWVGTRRPFMAYRILRGHTADLAAYAAAGSAERDRLAGSLAAFLAAMHQALTVEEVDELAIPTADSQQDVEALRSRLGTMPPEVRDDVSRLLDEVEASAPSAGPVVTLHNDFHFDNLVLDAPVGEVSGVWDFSCVQRGRPSADLRYIVGDSMDLLQRVANHYGRRTGAPVDLRAAVLAHRLEELVDLPDGNSDAARALVRSWRT